MSNTANYITWDSVTNITTVTALVVLIVQFTKSYIPIPTQVLSYIIATLILVMGDIHNRDWNNIPISFVNGFLVASLSSNSVALVDRLAG